MIVDVALTDKVWSKGCELQGEETCKSPQKLANPHMMTTLCCPLIFI